MKLCLDLQAAQSESRHRGIGRYSLGMAHALIARAAAHDVHLVLNGAFAETVEPLRAKFADSVPSENVHVFSTPGSVAAMDRSNGWRANAAQQVREAFLAELRPDVVHVSSMFEGWLDSAVTSIGAFEPGLVSACTLYDLIPLRHPDEYFRDAAFRSFYAAKVESLKRARLLLAISHSARNEAIESLGFAPDRVIVAGCGVDAVFQPRNGRNDPALVRGHGLEAGRYLLYVGGFDPRKNVARLVEAYARQSPDVRATYPLVLGGRISARDRAEVERTAATACLPTGAIRFTGGLDDDTLSALYRGAALFVFPSLYEGFGLPAAEAMASGTPTIAAASPGLREVIERRDALFDPASVDDMARVMQEALTSASLRASLRESGLAESIRFSWDGCGARALAALESLHDETSETRRKRRDVTPSHNAKPRLAFVSPLPPERTGIADYSAGLLPALAEHYAIDVVVDQSAVQSPGVGTSFPVRDLDWFEAHAQSYDRILYHVGNSPFHRRMIETAHRHPGAMVLHDFFRTGLLRWQAEHDGLPGALAQALYVSHGYAALHDEAIEGRDAACQKYPACLDVLQSAAGTIVHSTHAIDLAQRWFGSSATRSMQRVPMYVEPARRTSRESARQTLEVPDDALLVISLGFLAPTKLNHRLLEAWSASGLATNPRAYLCFVGENEGGSYGRSIQSAIDASAHRARIRITGFVPPAQFDLYLCAADIAVQLRTGSRGESSWAILRCLANGLPTIVNAHGSAAEFSADVIRRLSDEFEDGELSAALRMLAGSPADRALLGDAARSYVAREHAPAAVALRYRDAIEWVSANAPLLRECRLIKSIAAVSKGPVPDDDRRLLAEAIARQRTRIGPRQWLIDVSVVARTDLKTGIERVVRGIVLELLRSPPSGIRVEPVRDDGTGRYVYARAYAARLLALPSAPLPDEPIEVAAGDLFLGLDWYADGIPRLAASLEDLRNRGVALYFVVYDMLPVLLPEAFPHSSRPILEAWLQTLASVADGIVCISRSVARELVSWLDVAQPKRARPLRIGHFPLGSTIADTLPTCGSSEALDRAVAALARRAVLVVGTVEPRKAHPEVLAAFEVLWREGVNVNLVIVGKQGWMMNDFARDVRTHAELKHRLWWFDDATDDVLEKLYAGATGLIAASKGEGFGLPIVEAARHGIPVIARDLPVFREVGGAAVAYFSDDSPNAFAAALRGWLSNVADGTSPDSRGIAVIDWATSTRRLCEVLLERRWPEVWMRGNATARSDDVSANASSLPT